MVDVTHTVRLHEAVSAVAPVLGLSVGTIGVSASVRIDFDPSATAQQQTDAQGVVNAFDWALATHDAWLSQRERTIATSAFDNDRLSVWKALRATAKLLVDELTTIYQALPRPISTITRSGTTATATTPTAHGLSTGTEVFVFGATQAAYNGAKTITVTSATQFTYNGVTGNPATPATGTILYALSAASPPLQRTLAQAITALKNAITAGDVD